MFNFTFPWTKRREARKAAEQKARQDAEFVSAIVAVSMRGHERAQRARADVSTAPMRASQASTIDSAPENIGAPSNNWPLAGAPLHLAAGGGTFDGGGASGDWSSSACSSSSSDSSSVSSDSGSSCSSD